MAFAGMPPWFRQLQIQYLHVRLRMLLLALTVAEEEEAHRQRRRRTCWVKPWLQQRPLLGQYDTLMRELMREAHGDFKRFLGQALPFFVIFCVWRLFLFTWHVSLRVESNIKTINSFPLLLYKLRMSPLAKMS